MLGNLVALLEKNNVLEEYLVQSLDRDVIEKLKDMEPRIITGAFFAFNMESFPETTADSIVLKDYSVNERIIRQARDAGKFIFVWTINRERQMQEYLEKNVSFLITNHPGVAIQLRDDFDQNQSHVERIMRRIGF